MSGLQVFNSPEFGMIRITEIDGQPWFCLTDVCKPLELRPTPVKGRLKSGGVITIDTADSLGRPNKLLFINEPNLYRAIFQSKKPEAEKFTDWVTEEVLPALRKTGTYTTAQPAPNISLGSLANLISINRKIMIDMGATAMDIGKMVCETYRLGNVPVPEFYTKQIPGQLTLFEQRPALEA